MKLAKSESNSPIYPGINERIHDTAPTAWRSRVSLLAQHPQLLEGRVIDNLQLPYRLQAHQHHKFDIDWHIKQLGHLERSADFYTKKPLIFRVVSGNWSIRYAYCN